MMLDVSERWQWEEQGSRDVPHCKVHSMLLALFSYVDDFAICVTGPVSLRHSSSNSDGQQWPVCSSRLVLLERMMLVGTRQSASSGSSKAYLY
jgi:hypothetical protein